jgi:predicted amidohydrolase
MFGGSAIVAPTGEIVAQAQGEDDEVLFVNADLALGDTFRQHIFNFAKHRRPEHYRLIVDRVGAGDPLPEGELARQAASFKQEG